MTLIHQDTWHGLIAAYLFLGGLGGAVMALGAIADLFWQKNDASADRRPGIFGALAGLAALGVGSLILVYDLEQPLAAIYALSNFTSWITWGIIFITVYMAATALYLYPYLLQRRKVASPVQRYSGIAGAVSGLLVAVYTGFLLSGSTGIAFWNTPALPLLFVVSGFSTGAALMMLYLVSLKDSSGFAHLVLHKLERIDIGLVSVELLILFAYLNMAWSGSAAASHGAGYLFGEIGFVLGVPVFGLLIPLVLELVSIRKKAASLTAIASLLVLVGGALLRDYILKAGFFSLPWNQ